MNGKSMQIVDVLADGGKRSFMSRGERITEHGVVLERGLLCFQLTSCFCGVSMYCLYVSCLSGRKWLLYTVALDGLDIGV